MGFWLQLAGLGLVIIGIWFLVDDEAVHALKIVGDNGTMHMIKAAAVTILVVGFFALFIGVIGCWGSFRQKTSCLNIVSLSHIVTSFVFIPMTVSMLITFNRHLWLAC